MSHCLGNLTLCFHCLLCRRIGCCLVFVVGGMIMLNTVFDCAHTTQYRLCVFGPAAHIFLFIWSLERLVDHRDPLRGWIQSSEGEGGLLLPLLDLREHAKGIMPKIYSSLWMTEIIKNRCHKWHKPSRNALIFSSLSLFPSTIAFFCYFSVSQLFMQSCLCD